MLSSDQIEYHRGNIVLKWMVLISQYSQFVLALRVYRAKKIGLPNIRYKYLKHLFLPQTMSIQASIRVSGQTSIQE